MGIVLRLKNFDLYAWNFKILRNPAQQNLGALRATFEDLPRRPAA